METATRVKAACPRFLSIPLFPTEQGTKFSSQHITIDLDYATFTPLLTDTNSNISYSTFSNIHKPSFCSLHPDDSPSPSLPDHSGNCRSDMPSQESRLLTLPAYPTAKTLTANGGQLYPTRGQTGSIIAYSWITRSSYAKGELINRTTPRYMHPLPIHRYRYLLGDALC